MCFSPGGGDETRSGYVPVISANVPCTYYVHRDIHYLWYMHVPGYVLGTF